MQFIHDDPETLSSCLERWSGWKRYLYDCESEAISALVFVVLGVAIVAGSMLVGWVVVSVQDAWAQRRAEAQRSAVGEEDGERYRDELEVEQKQEEEDLLVL